MKKTAEMSFFLFLDIKKYSFSYSKTNRTIGPFLHNEPRTPTTRCAGSNLQFVGSHANKKIKKEEPRENSTLLKWVRTYLFI